MELLLVLLVLPPAFLAQRYGKVGDPNDEPFLPIYPVYPYSPKLIKRGTTDTDSSSQQLQMQLQMQQLQPSVDLYAPRPDAKDSYTSFATNYHRDPYYPAYNPYSKSPTSYSSYYSAATPGAPYSSYSTIPYSVYNSYGNHPYGPGPYTSVPYTGGYPAGYYYQPSYYYPSYYAQPLFPPPPPPPPIPATTGSMEDEGYSSGDSGKDEEKKVGQKMKDNDQDNSGQYMENGNYIGNSKDLDGQSSTFKVNSPYNQLDQSNDVQVKGLLVPLAKTSYRVVSVAGQPVGPDYPLPTSYAKAQQLEELMGQTLANLLNQQQQQQQQVARYSAYAVNQNGGPEGAENYSKPVAKPSYSVGSTVLQKVGQGNLGQKVFQSSLYTAKATKYPSLNSVTLEQSPGVYIPPSKSEQTGQGSSSVYQQYENQSQQSYEAENDEKPGQGYEDEQVQPISYQKQSFVTMHTPYNYQYSTYGPKTSTQQQTNLDDVNFGAKQTNKG